MKNTNVIVEKSKRFALRIIKLYVYLKSEKQEFILSKQLLRSGTSIGANIREATRAESKSDFYHKLNISLKEAEETAYWLELLNESDFITEPQFKSVYQDCNEIISLLVSITKNQKEISLSDTRNL